MTHQDCPASAGAPAAHGSALLALCLGLTTLSCLLTLWAALMLLSFATLGVVPLALGIAFWGECTAPWALQPCFALALFGGCSLLAHLAQWVVCGCAPPRSERDASVSIPALLLVAYLITTLAAGGCTHDQITWIYALAIVVLCALVVCCTVGCTCTLAWLGVAAKRADYETVV